MAAPKILLVDDDPRRDEVADRLRDAGYVVVTRSVAIGTAAAMVRERPDLVLWDVTMPLVSEVDLARLRSNPQIPDVTLVVYARLDPTELGRLVLHSGADGYVEKQDDPDAIVQAVGPWCRPRARRRKAQSGTERLARYVALAGDAHTHRRLLAVVGADTVVRRTDSGLEALRWIASSDPPDLVLAGTSLTDLPARELALRALAVGLRWRDRLVVVDEGAAGSADRIGDVPQRVWDRAEPLEGLLALLDGLRATG